ncbi:MAG: YggS family pyridoxal phosphate-dependent enzyme [Spartobacteria bacterium]|nr:YggS family pyridoxal phosphate-dependent enzyme [Spartobacteria bacterium]
METFSDRLAVVEERIEGACGRAGRAREAVRLVAVSKKHPPEQVQEAFEAGQLLFGENRVQEAQQKIPLCPPGIRWHMIGHLQGNKARLAVQLFEMIHSIDSLKLLRDVDRHAADQMKNIGVLLEVNVSGESVKHGMSPGEVEGVLNEATGLMHVDVLGLMTMPPYCEDPEKVRVYFRQLRELRDACRAATGFPLEELSMGMSHDFEVAIEEGATYIRVGTDLFGGR